MKTFESFDQLLEAVRAEKPKAKFDCVVSNPPYQMETAQKESEGQTTVTNVFQYFQEVADLIATRICMIYPGERWVSRSGKGMTDFGLEQINSKNLQKVLFWPDSADLFGATIGIAGGVTIVFKDFAKDNGGYWSLVNSSQGSLTRGSVALPGEEIVSLYPELNEILSKVRNISKGTNSLSQRGVSQKLFGIESSFAEENPEKVILCNSDFSNKPEGDEWIKLFTNDLAGKGGRGSTVWFYIKVQDIPRANDLIDKWKVISSSVNLTGINGSSPLVEIIEPGTAHGRARVSLGMFETEIEAINFFCWMKSDLIRLLIASSGSLLGSFGKNVPDPGDFTNSNSLIDFTESHESLNDQLCRIYGLNETDKSYMKSFVSKLAPFSKKSYSN